MSHRFIHAAAVLGTSWVALFAACGDDTSSDGGGDVAELTFEGEVELFPGFSYDSGLQPAGSPVQASFAVSAVGTTTVTAVAAASGSKGSPTLSGLPGEGAVALVGGFALLGNLVVDIDGLPSYDGPIPGIENVAIPFEDAVTFDPFAVDEDVAASAAIEPARLPGIPLPGGIPGQLVLEVAEGSSVDVTFTGRAVCVDEGEGRYDAALARGGVLVIRPLIEIDVPVVGTQTFEIPELAVDLALGTTDLTMRAEVERVGARPSGGDHVDDACSTDGGGGAGPTGAGGASGTSSTGDATSSTGTSGTNSTSASGGTACDEHADCGSYPCVEGQCSPGGGLCDSGYGYDDDALNACISASCCEALAACTYDYADVEGCNTCIANGGGARCDAFLECATAACSGGYPICDSGLSSSTQEAADCYGDYCCAELNDCTSNGTDVDACYDCLEQGGPLCDPVYICIDTYCAGI